MTGTHAAITATRFDRWEVRPVERQVLVGGQQVAVGSRAFDVLLALMARAGHVVSRVELLEAVWRDLVVEENNLSVQIAALRKLLGAETITTIPGRGYRFSARPLDGTGAANGPRPAPPPLPPPERAPGNIPHGQAELFGRADDLNQLVQLAAAQRLVSVVGAGGIGKTRLACAAARALQGRHPNGAWMVDLAPLSDPALLPAAVARALGLTLPGQRPPLDEVVDAIRDTALLLLLDNCEHVVDAASAFAFAVLERTRTARLLTTSQEPLKLGEETVFRLRPLSLPAGNDLPAAQAAGAVALLANRIAHVIPKFTLCDANRADLVEICRRLDGLPLAIELAAARVALFGLGGVRRRLAERFSVLTGGARSSLPRHRTLRATLEWSFALLDREERDAFCRLGVFIGSFGLDPAQHLLSVGEDAVDRFLDLLGTLVDKSLVMVEDGDPTRYRLLESARAYALEQLDASGDAIATHRAHARAICALFETSLDDQWALPSQERVRRYLPDLDNCRAAIEWAASGGDTDCHLALVGASAWLFNAIGQSRECLGYCQQAVARLAPDAPLPLRARLLHEMCGLAHYRPGLEKRSDAEQAVAAYRSLGDSTGLYRALGRMAITAALSGDGAGGERATLEMQSLFRPEWPPFAHWDSLNARDYVANALKRQDEAEQLADQQLVLANALGDTSKKMFALLARQQCTAARGAYAAAAAQAAELVALARREPYVDRMHVYVGNLATALVLAGHIDKALPVARECAALDRRNDTLWLNLELFAMLAAKRGRLETAALAMGRSQAANRWREEREPVEQSMYLELSALLARSLPSDRLRELLDRGEAMDNDEIARMALGD